MASLEKRYGKSGCSCPKKKKSVPNRDNIKAVAHTMEGNTMTTCNGLTALQE